MTRLNAVIGGGMHLEGVASGVEARLLSWQFMLLTLGHYSGHIVRVFVLFGFAFEL